MFTVNQDFSKTDVMRREKDLYILLNSARPALYLDPLRSRVVLSDQRSLDELFFRVGRLQVYFLFLRRPQFLRELSLLRSVRDFVLSDQRFARDSRWFLRIASFVRDLALSDPRVARELRWRLRIACFFNYDWS
jgi:hypothetical protein